MKTRNLFLSLFAFAALCACNKEAQPEIPQILDADTYIKVNIKASGATTRAYELGEDQENAVNTVDFLFYGTRNQPVTEASVTWTPQTDGDNVAAKSAKIQFKAQTEKPTSMIVVLNYAGNINDLKAKSLADAKATVTTTDLYKEFDAKPYYTMSNTVYTNDDSNAENAEDVICEVKLVDANFGVSDTKDALVDATPVDVYVERVAAKVVLTNNITPATTDVTPTDIYINGMGEATTVTPVVVGYDVVNTPDESYLFKQVDPAWAYPSWTKREDFRSFWADSYAPVDYINKNYNEVHTDAGAPYITYVHENTSETKTTKVILTAKLTVEDGSFGAAMDANPDVLELVQYSGKYYTLNGFITEAKNVVKTSKGINIDDKVLDAIPEANNYEMHLKLADGHGLTAVDANTVNDALAMMVASYWNQGKCYYFTEIKHDLKASNAAEAPLLSGVVRNHVYKVSLNSIKGLGIPVSGEATETIIPEETVDKYYSLNATINILQWKVVSQGVDFNN